MLPNTLRIERQARGLSQSALADRARVSQPTISAIERGDLPLSPRVLHGLSAALGVAPSVLAGRGGHLRRSAAKNPEAITAIIADAAKAIALFDGVLAEEAGLDHDYRAQIVAARAGAAALRDAALELASASTIQ
jgi:transcriptional regulator with XRE-family HTH domain